MNRAKLRRVYAFWAPVYNALYERFYRGLRVESIAHLKLQPDDAVLIIGAGTGSDFDLLAGSRIIAVDASTSMLKRSRKRAKRNRVEVLLADGEELPFRDETFDAAVLHLVLTVTPVPQALLAETGRVLRVGGRVAVCDHFAPPPAASGVRRAVSPLTELLGARLDRTFEQMAQGLPFVITRDDWRTKRSYRLLQLRREP